MGMVSDEEDSRDFDCENGSNLTAPVTDLTGVTGGSQTAHVTTGVPVDEEGFTELTAPSGSETTDVSAVLPDSGSPPEVSVMWSLKQSFLF